MSPRALLAIVLFIFAAEATASYPKRGRIKFEKRRVNFGDVYRGQTLTHVFAFKNIGKGKLSIHGVHASCGCTAVEIDKNKQYGPGEVGQVEVKFDTSDFSGRITKIVTVITNEKVLPDRSLTVTANVKSEFDVQPPLFSFGEPRRGDTPTKTVKIKPIGKFKLEVKKVEFNKELVNVTHKMIDGVLEVAATLQPKLAVGFVKDNVFVHTTSQNMPKLKIPVRASIKGYVQHSPDYLEFGAVAPGDKSKRALTLVGGKEVKITGSRADLMINGKKVTDAKDFLIVSSVPHQEERRLVSIELVNASESIGNVHGKLYLTTDHQLQKEITVDFYAFFR